MLVIKADGGDWIVIEVPLPNGGVEKVRVQVNANPKGGFKLAFDMVRSVRCTLEKREDVLRPEIGENKNHHPPGRHDVGRKHPN